MNAYLLLAGIVGAVGCYMLWTRRADEAGGFGLQLLIASALLVLTATGKYLATFALSHQGAAVIIGLSGLLLSVAQRPNATRRAPFGLRGTSLGLLVVMLLVTLMLALRTETSLYDGWPVISTMLCVALLTLFIVSRPKPQRQIALPATNTPLDRPSDETGGSGV